MCAPAKCLAIILERKLSAFLEAHSLRAAGQFGFRRKSGTHLALFVMRHLQASAQRAGAGVLYACLIDFAKAFDTVQRPPLWEALRRLGLTGKLLSTVQCLYSAVRMRVKLSGRVGDVFESLLGVKQGDPLSPVLFGAFIEVLPAFIAALNADLTPRGTDMLALSPDLDGLALFYLLFADDLTLLTRCPDKLRLLLASLHNYCITFGMTVNVLKTEVLVLGTAPAVALAIAQAASSPIAYDGVPLRVVSSARYLGLTFAAAGTKAANETALCTAATRTRFVLQRNLFRLPPLPPATQIHLFNALVRPVLMYGAQVWGAEYLKLPPRAPLTVSVLPTSSPTPRLIL
jgi:hypothetical protein